ncbi:hypothetical protein SUGI_1160070 [Cryptomeria japonica]|nr:hypothetical protein SUGI_1160070 [Cryptomeria japonica]
MEREEESLNNRGPVSYWKLVSFSDPLDYFLMLVGTVSALLHGIINPLNMVIFGKIVNSFGSNQFERSKAAHELAWVLLILAANSFWVTWLEVTCWMSTGERQTVRMRGKYLECLLNQDIQFFEEEDSDNAQIVTSVATDPLLVQEAIGEKVGVFLHMMGTFAGGIVIAMVTCWQIGLLILGSVPLMLITGLTYGYFYKRLAIKNMSLYAKDGSVIQQAISQVRTVYACGGEAKEEENISLVLEEAMKVGLLSSLVRGVGLGIIFAIINCSWAVALWFGGILISHKTVTPGQVITSVFCIIFSGMALGEALPNLQIFQNGRLAGRRIFNMIERTPKINIWKSRGKSLTEVKGEITFENVSFYYPSRPTISVFSGLSFTISAGKTMALVGSSGSGKSTAISIIQRFYDVTSGRILFDGEDIRDLNLRWYRMQIGWVSQEPILFRCSIKENILYGNSTASMVEVEAATEAANANTFIKSFPKGYDTKVGEKGIQLSGGQKQRIAIARAILKKPSILIFDEATSALDPESEQIVQSALESIMVGHTSLVIAHRLSTIRQSDCIAFFCNGKITEMGTHEELVSNGTAGDYARLLSLQETKVEEKNDIAESISEKLQGQSSNLHELSENTSFEQEDFSICSSNGTEAENDRRGLTNKLERGSYLDSLSPETFAVYKKLTGPNLPSFFIGTTGAIFAGTVNPLFALVLMEVVAIYFETDIHNIQKDVQKWAIVCAGLGIAAICTSILQYFFLGKAGENSSKTFQVETFKAIMKNEVGWFDREENGSSSITANILADFVLVKNTISDYIPSLFQCLTSTIMALIIAFLLEWHMALVTFLTFPVVMAGGSIKEKFMKRGLSGDLRELHEQACNIAYEGVGNIRTVASYCAEDNILGSFKKHLTEPLKKHFVMAHKMGIVFGGSQCALFSANALSLWYGSLMVKQKIASFSTVLKVFLVLGWTAYFLSKALTLLPDIQRGASAASSLLQLKNRRTKIDPDNPSAKTLQELEGKIEFQNVVFHYPSRPNYTVLSGIDLSIESGILVALIGSSGSGKSSMLSLLLRFYDPNSGRILIDGTDIKTMNLRWLRRQIGMVFQEPVLFATSIKDNILYGNEHINASEAEIVEAAISANAHEFISNLPEGYSTTVGGGGSQLSGGQKQRIAVARALLRKGRILLMDEGTSALDSESEQGVLRAIEQAVRGGGCTCISVCHRMTWMNVADKIFQIQNGKLLTTTSPVLQKTVNAL